MNTSASSSPAAAASQALLADGQPREALAALQTEVRARPADAALRTYLFQLLCVLGQWERAAAQLDVCAQLDASTLAMVNTYREALRCERMREAVFAGRHTPVVMGAPQPWVAWLVAALQHEAEGRAEAAGALRAQALDAAPASSGLAWSADALATPAGDDEPAGTPFQWVADADSRLGPVLEVIVNGRYAWLPFAALRTMHIDPPEDLRDLVWAPAHLELLNGGETVALVPTRYAPMPADADGATLMARSTRWRGLRGDQFAGEGQRIIATDAEELPLLQWRRLRFDVAPEAEAAGDNAEAASA